MALRVGVVGAGNIFERGYLPALASTEAVVVTAVTDLDPERASAAARRLDGAVVAGSADDVLARDDVDAVLVLIPTHAHAAVSIAALEAGRHVLCEKPMARTVADAEAMADAARRTGRRLMIGHSRRFDERWLAIADQIRAGRVGDPVYVYRSEHAWAGAPASGWQWQAAASGGVLWDVGIHAAELFHWFLGGMPVTAFTKLLRARPEARAGGASDAAVVTFDFGPGRHAVLSVSWLHPPSWAPFYATTDVVGTAGRIEASDRDSNPLVVAGQTLEVARHSPLLSATASTFRREVEHFVAAVEAGAPFAIEAEDAIVAMRMIEAAERSAASGRPEPVMT